MKITVTARAFEKGGIQEGGIAHMSGFGEYDGVYEIKTIGPSYTGDTEPPYSCFQSVVLERVEGVQVGATRDIADDDSLYEWLGVE